MYTKQIKKEVEVTVVVVGWNELMEACSKAWGPDSFPTSKQLVFLTHLGIVIE